MFENFLLGFAGVGVFAILFILMREFWCWYFKLNEIKGLLEKIEENTRKSDEL